MENEKLWTREKWGLPFEYRCLEDTTSVNNWDTVSKTLGGMLQIDFINIFKEECWTNMLCFTCIYVYLTFKPRQVQFKSVRLNGKEPILETPESRDLDENKAS